MEWLPTARGVVGAKVAMPFVGLMVPVPISCAGAGVVEEEHGAGRDGLGREDRRRPGH